MEKQWTVRESNTDGRMQSDVIQIDAAIYPKWEWGVLCGNLLAQFRDQSAETLWLKPTAVWEMPNGAGRIQAHIRTYRNTHSLFIFFIFFKSLIHTHMYLRSHLNVHKYWHTRAKYNLCDHTCNICKRAVQCTWANLLTQYSNQCQLQMRQLTSVLIGDTKLTWLLSIKLVKLIFRLADFRKKSFFLCFTVWTIYGYSCTTESTDTVSLI